MKLYYSPGACSLSPHIALLEAGLPYELVKVDLRAKKLENGDDYLKVNPKGQVPALALDSGELVTEGPVIVQMIADKVDGQEPRPRPRQRRALQAAGMAHLSSPPNCTRISARMFSPGAGRRRQGLLQGPRDGQVQICRNRELAGKDYLMGKQFTVADGYLFTMLSWAERMKFDLSDLPNLWPTRPASARVRRCRKRSSRKA